MEIYKNIRARATIDDLEREVRRLRKRVSGLEGPREEEQVAELVADSDPQNQPSRHSFSNAVAASTAALCEELEGQAVSRLRSGTVAERGPSVAAFRNDFARLGATKLDELLSKYR